MMDIKPARLPTKYKWSILRTDTSGQKHEVIVDTLAEAMQVKRKWLRERPDCSMAIIKYLREHTPDHKNNGGGYR